MQDLLVYDGACGICLAAARFAERCDRAQRFVLLPYQQISAEELQRRGTTAARCAQRVHVVTARGKVHTGAFAVNYFLWQYYPWKIFVALIYLLPLLLLLEIIGYAWVAQQRQRISRWLGLNACALPPFAPSPIQTS